MRIDRECPDPLAGNSALFRINARPRCSTIDRAINASANLASLISIAHKDLVAVLRVYQNTGEVSVRKIAAPASPARAIVTRHEESLFGSYIDRARTLRTASDHIYGNVGGNTGYMPPGSPAISGHHNAGCSGSGPDGFRMIGIH